MTTPIRAVIHSAGGPAAFRRALSTRHGIAISLSTVRAWNSPGAAHREPPPWITAALAVLLNGRIPSKR